MSDAKVLQPNAWKAVSTKYKVQNNDLQKALVAYDQTEDDEHDDLLECLADIKEAVTAYKKSKEAAANKDLVKYLTECLSATDSEQREVTKDKVEAEKKDKQAEATKKKEEDAGDGESDEDEEEEGAYKDKLTAALKKLKGSKDVVYQFIVCDGKPPAVMMAKKIGSKHKDELAKVTGSKRFLHIGECRFDGNNYVFDMAKPVTGLAKKLQESIKHHTGKRQPIKVGTEAAGDEEDAATAAATTGASAAATAKATDGDETSDTGPSADAAAKVATATGAAAGATAPKMNMTGPFQIKGSVGKGGKNLPEDVQAAQVALNKKAKAGLAVDGKCGPAVIGAIVKFQQQMGMPKPDGRIDPGRGTMRALASSGPLPPIPPSPKPVAAPKLGKAELAKAPAVWEGLREIIDKNIEALKKAVEAHYAHEHPDLIADIQKNLTKLDGITDKLDHRIADSLKKANAAKDDAAKKAELKSAKTILAEYIGYVKSEPLIAHADANPWVKIDLKKTVIDHITHLAQAIG